MEQQTGSKEEKEFVKAVYCHPVYLTSMLEVFVGGRRETLVSLAFCRDLRELPRVRLCPTGFGLLCFHFHSFLYSVSHDVLCIEVK